MAKAFQSMFLDEMREDVMRMSQENVQPGAFQSFGRGFGESLTLGAEGEANPYIEQTSGQSIAHFAGQIAGELPFFLIGGTAVKGALKALRVAPEVVEGLTFGRKVLHAAGRAAPLSEFLTAEAVDVGRNVVSGDDTLTPGRIAFNLVTPYLPGLIRKAKTTKSAEDVAKRAFRDVVEDIAPEAPSTALVHVPSAGEVFGELADASVTRAKGASGSPIKGLLPSARALPRGPFIAGSEGIISPIHVPENDRALFQAMDNIWRTSSGSVEHVDALTRLYAKGAPLDEIGLLNTTDDVADYLSVVMKGEIPRSWHEEAARRSSANLDEVRQRFMFKFRGMPDGTSPFVDETAMRRFFQQQEGSGRPLVMGEDMTPPGDMAGRYALTQHLADPTSFVARQVGLGTPEASLRWGIPLTNKEKSAFPFVRDADVDAFYRNLPAPGGGSGAFDPRVIDPNRGFTIEQELEDMAWLEAPRDRGEFVGKVIGTVRDNAITRNWLMSSAATLESMGRAGKELSSLMMRSRRWNHMRSGTAISRIFTTLDGMTDDQLNRFVRVADQGPDAVAGDEAIDGALRVYRAFQKDIEGEYVRMGAMVRRGDGTLVPLSEAKIKNYFPHYHDWEQLLRMVETPANDREARIAKMAMDSMVTADLVPDGMPRSEALKLLIRRKMQQRTHALHTREINAPGWLGDPELNVDPQAYRQNVYRALSNFFQDNYRTVGNMKFLGTPSDIGVYDEFSHLTDLSVIHNALKKRISGASETLANRMSAGKAIDPAHDVARIAAFKNVPGLEAAAQAGDPLAQQLKQEASAFMHDRMRGWGATARRLVQEIGIEGGDTQLSEKVLDTFMGLRQFSPAELNITRAAVNYNIVTKLGLAVVENATQSAFTASRFGIRNTFAAIREAYKDPKATLRFANESGALLEDWMRTVEGDAGEIGGQFLRGSGFAWIEKWNRAIAATAGKHHVMGLVKQLAENPASEAVIRDLDRLGFHRAKMVKDGQLTPLAQRIVQAVHGDGDAAVAEMVGKIAGFEGSRATQFLADVMDKPIVASSPAGRIMFQFKSFAFNGARAFTKDIANEAQIGLREMAKGNVEEGLRGIKPFVRLVLLGATLGEVSQDARALLSGKTVTDRGQQGSTRELVGDILSGTGIDQDDATMFTLLGQRFSTSDVATRILQNIAGVGYAGVFVTMAQAAMTESKLPLLQLAAGPTIDSAVGAITGVASAAMGDPTALGRQVLREAAPAAAAFAGVPGLPVVAAAAGRHAQVAALPSDFQKRESRYVSPDDVKEIAVARVVHDYNIVRQDAAKLIKQGRQDDAIARIQEWNARLPEKLGILREVDALSRSASAKITFSGDDVRNLILSVQAESMKANGLAKFGQRVGGAFQGVAGL